MQKLPKIEQIFCSKCGTMMKQLWENNGFEEPDPTHWELIGYECPECGHKEN